MAKAKKTKGTVRFKTKRGRVVSFKLTGKPRRKTAQNRKIGAAGKACAKKGKVGSKKNTACIVNYLKSH